MPDPDYPEYPSSDDLIEAARSSWSTAPREPDPRPSGSSGPGRRRAPVAEPVPAGAADPFRVGPPPGAEITAPNDTARPVTVRPAPAHPDEIAEPGAPGGSGPVLRVVRVAAVAAIVIGWAATSLFDGSTSVTDLAVGDCFDDPGGEVVAEIDTIQCAEPHDFEVFANVEVPGADGAVYPGDDALASIAAERCLDHFASYVGIPYEESVWWMYTLSPDPESWDLGDRGANCVLYNGGFTGEVSKVTGSARGAGT